jgi:hypothetical protein
MCINGYCLAWYWWLLIGLLLLGLLLIFIKNFWVWLLMFVILLVSIGCGAIGGCLKDGDCWTFSAVVMWSAIIAAIFTIMFGISDLRR